jgi:hypothetical protein
MEHGSDHAVVSPAKLRAVAVRVNAPELTIRAVLDEPLTSFESLRVGVNLQQVVVLGGLSGEVWARVA